MEIVLLRIDLIKDLLAQLLQSSLCKNISALLLQSEITYDKIAVFGSIDYIQFTFCPFLFVCPLLEFGNHLSSRDSDITLIVNGDHFLRILRETDKKCNSTRTAPRMLLETAIVRMLRVQRDGSEDDR